MEKLITDDDIASRFPSCPDEPKPGQPRRYGLLMDEARHMVYIIQDNCPASRERSLALTKLEEAIMWANASIARNE